MLSFRRFRSPAGRSSLQAWVFSKIAPLQLLHDSRYDVAKIPAWSFRLLFSIVNCFDFCCRLLCLLKGRGAHQSLMTQPLCCILVLRCPSGAFCLRVSSDLLEARQGDAVLLLWKCTEFRCAEPLLRCCQRHSTGEAPAVGPPVWKSSHTLRVKIMLCSYSALAYI